jgi:hypothetical protein
MFIAFGCHKRNIEDSENKEGSAMEINEPIKCTINATANGNIIKLMLVFENMTNGTVSIPKSFIFVDDYPSDVARCLSINRGKICVEYIGPVVFRGPDEYYEFLPHSKITQNIELNTFFNISQTGKYKVVYSALVFPKETSGSSVAFQITSNTAYFDIK